MEFFFVLMTCHKSPALSDFYPKGQKLYKVELTQNKNEMLTSNVKMAHI